MTSPTMQEAAAVGQGSDAATKMAKAAQRVYQTHRERAALRCGMSDAAHLCDIIAVQIKMEHKARDGRMNKTVKMMMTVAIRCGDAIWEMRQKIDNPPTDARPEANP